ncbi:MAG TPA: hypothetical protein VNK26_05820 [Pyrinomonadaceae bacterium]|nr:hypothetical protein [Pyrinomonadaceae bacterium]
MDIARYFLAETLPEPLTPASEHLQIFDNYIPETNLRLRTIRNPKTRQWRYFLQKRILESPNSLSKICLDEIELSQKEYEKFSQFEGREIRKNRYFFQLGDLECLIVVYLGKLWGINRVKIPLFSEDELGSFWQPEFTVLEITHDVFFAEENLVDLSFAEVALHLEKAAATS